MANGINLPRTNTASKSDLITVIQNGTQKNITKGDLLNFLEDSIKDLTNQISSTNTTVSRNAISTTSPSFLGTVSANDPVVPKNLTTKKYVDNLISTTVKSDGSSILTTPLSYQSVNNVYKNTDVVPKDYIDSKLRQTLKTVSKLSDNLQYPGSNVGDTYIVTSFSESFALNGPEVQEGDILICIENSNGGTHEEVGHQFAIINTNVVFSSEENPGIIRVASEQELNNLNTNASAITPLKYKRALELGSEHSRIIVTTPEYIISNETKGIIGVDCRYNDVTIVLPQISGISSSSITKYIIKDEYLAAAKHNITIVPSGDNTIQSARSINIKTAGGAIKLYNDGEKQWLVENTSSLSSSGGSAGGAINITTDNISTGETLSNVTGASDFKSALSVDVDLRDYPIGTGFKIVMHSVAAANGNTKGTAIGVNGQQILKSSLTGVTAPNLKFIHQELTVLNSTNSKHFVFGTVILGDNSASQLANNIDLDWDTVATISADINAPTLANDVGIYALQILPLI